MRILTFTLLFSCFLYAGAQTINCPSPDSIKIAEGWALTSDQNNFKWSGSLAQDHHDIGQLRTMSLAYSNALSGYVLSCTYDNATLSSVAAITGICEPRGILQDCTKPQQHVCVVGCNLPQSSDLPSPAKGGNSG